MTATPLNTQLEFTPGDQVRLTAAHDGGSTDVSWRWVPPAGSSAPASTTNVLEWVTGANDAGVYDVEVTSPTAPDSPSYGVIRLDKAVVPSPPDPDADIWIAAVEAEDGQSLEPAVRTAMNELVVRLKATTGWAAMVNFLPLTAARTLAGALVPLKGVAPTMQNWTAGDYSRTAGITGDFTSKAGTVPLVLSRDDNHLSAYHSGTDEDGPLWGFGFMGSLVNIGPSGLWGPAYLFSNPNISPYNYGEAEQRVQYVGGFCGVARNSSSLMEVWHTSVVPSSTFENLPPGGPPPPADSLTGIMCAWTFDTGLSFFMSGTCCCYSHGTYYDQPMEVRAVINQYLAELEAALLPARARMANGQFIADDPSTPDVNEAWVTP